MNIFSLRAECAADVDVLRKLLNSSCRVSQLTEQEDTEGFPDRDVEIRTELCLVQMQMLLGKVPDGHVMEQTLRPVALADNSLERDYDAGAPVQVRFGAILIGQDFLRMDIPTVVWRRTQGAFADRVDHIGNPNSGHWPVGVAEMVTPLIQPAVHKPLASDSHGIDTPHVDVAPKG